MSKCVSKWSLQDEERKLITTHRCKASHQLTRLLGIGKAFVPGGLSQGAVCTYLKLCVTDSRMNGEWRTEDDSKWSVRDVTDVKIRHPAKSVFLKYFWSRNTFQLIVLFASFPFLIFLYPNRKVAGSIPGGVIGNFHWHNPSGRTMVLGLTQPLTEMSKR